MYKFDPDSPVIDSGIEKAPLITIDKVTVLGKRFRVSIDFRNGELEIE
ncbi:MAG: hypothetical protein ACLFVX_11030 [Archaeoglobaceae archaeon]